MDESKLPYKQPFASKVRDGHRLAAIMFTDIVGFTEIMGKNEQNALHLLEKNRNIQKSIIGMHNGNILKEIGDGMLVSFDSSNDSVLCAKEIINAIRDETVLSLRIGIHEGDIIFKDNDVYGDGVNIASRILDEAHEGGICISDSVYNDIKNKPDIHAEFIEEKTLKNVDRPIKIYSVFSDDFHFENTHLLAKKSTTNHKKSIIVLPFHNISSDKNQEYFSDGLTEEIITDLSRIQKFRVISRNSTMCYKGSNKNTQTIAKEVNAQYVLEGSVRKSGERLRISVQLVDVLDDAPIWSEKFNGTLEDVFDIQESVSQSIVDALKTQLDPEDVDKLTARQLKNPLAMECYFKAKQEMEKMTENGLSRSLDELNKGIEIDGENALFYETIGLIYFYYYETGISNDKRNLHVAQDYAQKALKINPRSSTGYFLLGAIERFLGDSAKATEYLTLAVEFDSLSLNAMLYLSRIYSLQYGNPLLAESHISSVLDIDPVSPMNYVFLGFIQWMENKLDFAISSFQKSSNLNPQLIYAKLWEIYGLAWKGHYEQAIELIDQIFNVQPENKKDSIIINWCIFFKYALQGKRLEAISILHEETKNYFLNDPELLWLGVINFTLIDEKEEALDWLERAIKWGWVNYPLFAKKDPFLKKLREEKRFKKLLDKMKIGWENENV